MSLRSVEERREVGREARSRVPRTLHADFAPAAERRDPVALIAEQDATRVPWLVPVRHSRMSASSFAFFRGTARVMAADLSGTATSGLEVQLGGDGHLANFGAYASPERSLIADANDFDETLRGPWEWDLKRLTTSFMIAARYRGFSRGECRKITARCARAYREAMAEYADMGFLQLWYEYSTVDNLADLAGAEDKQFVRRLVDFERRARSKDSLQALEKLAENVEGRFRLKADHPVLVPIREVLPERSPEEIDEGVRSTFAQYLTTLRPDRRMLLERYELVDIALKVVGVGSVGTRCYVLLLEGRDAEDPLFLQAKEANASVLEEFLGPSGHAHHGERVVDGQRMIQAQSDIFLGWASGPAGINFYFRQLRDWKGSFDVDAAAPKGLGYYASICGKLMARGHARTGDPESITAYMGTSDKLDGALVEFSERYAQQTEADYAEFTQAIADGVLEVSDEV